MAIDLNRDPYFDNYDPDKGFYRILFRPGFAVQTRELNQLQTILQEQVSRFGSHVFKNGSLVDGGAFHINNSADYIKVNFDQVTEEAYEGMTLTALNGVTATIVTGFVENDESAFMIRYTSAATGDPSTKTFDANQAVTIVETGETFTTLTTDRNPIGKGSIFKIDEGVIFAEGQFIRFLDTKIVVSGFNQSPTADVGFIVSEDIITSDDDQSLLDNANGTFNFAAPGAHRLKYSLGLAVKAIDAEEDDRFLQLYRINNGEVVLKYDRPQLDELLDELASRTYDESGHYTTDRFQAIVKEHLKSSNNNGVFTLQQGGDSDKLVVDVSSGKAFVKGYEVEKLVGTKIEIDKSKDTEFLDNQSFTINVGNFVRVNEVAGSWCTECGSVSIRDTAAQAVTNTSFGSTAAPGSEIGTAKLYSIKYESGTIGSSDAEYLIYLFDIRMNAGKTFSADAKSLYLESATAGDSFADINLNDDNEAIIYDRNIFPLIYKLPQSNIQKIRDEVDSVDTSYEFRKRFSVDFGGDPTVTITITEPNEVFPYGSNTTLSATQLEEIIVVEDTGEIHPVTSAVTGSTTSMTITVDTNLNAATVITRARNTQGREARKELLRNRVVKIDPSSHPNGTNGPYSLGVADVFRIASIHVGDSYSLSNPDLKDNFIFSDGQKATFYDHSTVTPKTPLNSGDKVYVVFDFFDHDYSQGRGYFSVDSYPVDDSDLEDPNTIRTWEIPAYEGTELRDSIDVRKKLEATADTTKTVSSSPANATENPGSTDLLEPTGNAATNLIPDRLFVADFHYYLAYYAVIGLNKNGEFKVYKSESSESPLTPDIDTDVMHVATIRVTPYPSLAPKFAKRIGKDLEAVDVNTINNRRYTFSDIRSLERRVESVEYYTSLSLLEEDTNNLKVLDENDQERFKNGFFVDPFIDHSVGAYKLNGYNVAVNPGKGELVPANKSRAIGMLVQSSSNTNRD
jgi:hypothetical protein